MDKDLGVATGILAVPLLPPALRFIWCCTPQSLCPRAVCGLVFTQRRKGPRRQGVLWLRLAPRAGWGWGDSDRLVVSRARAPAEFKVWAGLTGASHSHLTPHSPSLWLPLAVSAEGKPQPLQEVCAFLSRLLS